LLSIIPDKHYLPIYYRLRTGKKLNLKHPATYNEKLQWLKLYDRNPLYTTLSDKYAVRKYIADAIGAEHLIPLIGVYDSFDEIDFDKLPNQFVIKCTHDSGSVIICNDKSTFNIAEAGKYMKIRLKRNYYYKGREWCYKDIKPRIVIEKYLTQQDTKGLNDYKIYCFGGKPKMIQVDFDRFVGHKKNLYTPEWEYISVMFNYPTHPESKIEKPKNLNRMLEIAQHISNKFVYVRVDLYCVSDKIYFGEMTFFPASGCGKIDPASFDAKMGSWLMLPEVMTSAER